MENLPTDYFVTSWAYTRTVYRDQYPAIDPTSSLLTQRGKVVIITGASSGIGAHGFAPAFAKAQPKAIILVGRSEAKLHAVENMLRKFGRATEFLSVPTDLTSPASVDHLFSIVRDRYGHADVLISNTGMLAPPALIVSADPSTWWSDFETNVRGSFLIIQGFLTLLGTERRGWIVQVGSGTVTGVVPGMSAYCISKLAGLEVAEYAATEYPNVSAVGLHPGMVMTDLTLDHYQRFALDTPELVGGVGVWLATDAARFLSGRFISANWSVVDLLNRKSEILAGNDLKIIYQGKFGLDQFR